MYASFSLSLYLSLHRQLLFIYMYKYVFVNIIYIYIHTYTIIHTCVVPLFWSFLSAPCPHLLFFRPQQPWAPAPVPMGFYSGWQGSIDCPVHFLKVYILTGHDWPCIAILNHAILRLKHVSAIGSILYQSKRTFCKTRGLLLVHLALSSHVPFMSISFGGHVSTLWRCTPAANSELDS